MTDWSMLRYVVVDVEGNGQHPADLVEVAAVSIVAGVVGEPTSWLVKPPRPIKRFATSIHGLCMKDLVDCPPFDAVADHVRDALDADVVVAHNAHVDVAVLRRELPGWEPPETLDTLTLARRLLPGLPRYRLTSLADELHLAHGLPDHLHPHRAAYDAVVTARLFVHLAHHCPDLAVLRGVPPEDTTDHVLF